MRILCVSAPLPGHLDWGGYLSTAVELQRRGHELCWASGSAVESQIRRAGISFQKLTESGWRWPPPPPLVASQAQSPEAWQQLRVQRALDQWLDEERVGAAIIELQHIAESWQPDLVISEMFIAAAGIVAEMVQRPLVIAGWPAQLIEPSRPDPAIALARQRLDRLLARHSVNGHNWSKVGAPALLSPLLHLSYWSQSWFAGQKLLAQTRHVGGIAAPRQPPDPTLPNHEDRPWVLITLGTSFGNDPNFFVAASHAAQRLGCLPILALGNQIMGEALAALQSKLPTTAIVRNYVNFQAVLPYCAAAIHHGGAGTTHALVTSGVPQIVVPHAADQQRQAQGVMRSNVGLAFAPKDVTIDLLEDGLAAILPDRSDWRTAAHHLCEEFAALGGVVRAADYVCELV